MAIGADSFKIVLVSEEGIGGSGKTCAEGVAHGVDHVFMPEKAVPASRAEVADAEIGNAAQTLQFFPKPGFRARVKNVQLQLAQRLERGPRLQFADLGECINLPHRCS